MASLQDTNYEKLVDRLLEQIMRGELRKGQKLPTERQMAEDMNVSRTSIREALKSLGAMGITYSIQGSGTYITDHPENTINKALCALFALSDGTLDNILQLRILLETDAKTQRERILRRNGEEMLSRFLTRWIPLENAYFAATDVSHRCDMLLRVTPDARGDNEYEVIQP